MKKFKEPVYQTIEQMVAAVSAAVRPPERITVSQAAEKYRYLNNPGSYVGEWQNSKTPYLCEPMDTFTSLDYTGVVFVGPARTGKSDMFFNWLGHTAICDPSDMMMVHMTQNTARDWSQGDLRKVFRHSPKIGATVAPGRQNLNVHDIKFISGMRLLVKWPTISELSGKTVRYVWLNDYDRGEEIIEKEGIKWDLAKKRTTTFKRFAMTVAESSPGRDISDPQWMPRTPHEAPPTGDDKTPGGILALYNRGDRRRWHWRCPQCKGTFEPDFELLEYPQSSDPMECAANVHMICPHDGFPLTPDMQYEMNLGGRWVKEGQIWMPDGSMVGPARQTDIASFWLKGPAAAFTTWNDLVLKYETARQEFEVNGNEDPLRGTVTLDQGRAYLPKSREAARLPETLKARAEDWGGSPEAPVVPHGTRFLIATVDVQKGAFVVQVHGFGANGDTWIVDMFRITKSERNDVDGHPERIDPAGHPEDWHVLLEKVILRTYPLADDSGRRMMIKVTGCDSGGREGVTANAYAFYRWLRDQGEGHHARFALVKGVDSKAAQQRVKLEYPDSGQRGINAVARGDVPVHMLSSNLLKDQASAMLNRDKPGTEKVGGMIHFPKWAPEWLYKQLTAEVKTSKGWENKSGRRNEAWDLLYYALGLAIYHPISWERINWDDAPGWAAEWDQNDLVYDDSLNLPFTTHSNGDYDLTKLGEQLA